MKRLMFLAFMLIGFGAMAQSGPEAKKTPKSPEERAARLTHWMVENLQLTAAQKEAVTAINLAYADKAATVKEEHEGNRRGAMQALRSLNGEKDEELAEVLDENQMATYQEGKKQLMKRMRKRREDKQG